MKRLVHHRFAGIKSVLIIAILTSQTTPVRAAEAREPERQLTLAMSPLMDAELRTLGSDSGMPPANTAPSLSLSYTSSLQLTSRGQVSTGITLIASDDGRPGPLTTSCWFVGDSDLGSVRRIDATHFGTTFYSPAGTRSVRCQASDGDLKTIRDAGFTVAAAPSANRAPTIDLGANQTVTLTNSSVVATTSMSITDENVLTVRKNCRQAAGPQQATVEVLGTTLRGTFYQANADVPYVMRCDVTDEGGLTASADWRVTVLAAPNQPPVAAFGMNPNPAKPGETVTFDGGASSDPDGQIVEYLWDFKDGQTSSGRVATHAYTQPGTFQPVLRVRDNRGSMSEVARSLHVLAAAAHLSIKGRVLLQVAGKYGGSSGGPGLAGVMVQLKDHATGQLIQQTLTAIAASPLDGMFQFSDVPVGNYDVMPVLTGYTFDPAVRSVNLTADAQLEPFIATPLDDAAFVSQDAPVKVALGADFQVRFTMRNTGRHAWQWHDQTYTMYAPVLTAQSYSWTAHNAGATPLSVSVGQAQDYVYTLNAPTQPGRYAVQWEMARTTFQTVMPFGQTTGLIWVTVDEPPAQNLPPRVNAGPDQTIQQPASVAAFTTVSGSATDDKLPVDSSLTYQWSKVSGPGTATFATPSNPTSKVTFASTTSQNDVYTLRLTVSDGQLSASDDVVITVQAAAQVATPAFNPNGGVFGQPVTLAISTSTSEARIYYTTNGQTPTEVTGILYTQPIQILNTTTVMARAYRNGYVPSPIASAQFLINAIGTNCTVTASPSQVALGGAITAMWQSCSTLSRSDVLAVYRQGAQDRDYIPPLFSTGGASGGTTTFPAPADPGTYEVRLLSAGTQLAQRVVSNPVQVVGPPPPSTGYAVSGRITTADGRGQVGVHVQLSSTAPTPPPPITGLVTDAEGRYRFERVPSGPYIVTPELAGYTFDRRIQFISVQNADVTGVDFVAKSTGLKTGAITGLIFTQVGGVRRPVAGGVVLLQDTATHREIARATADATGTYRFSSVPFGTYDLVPVPSGGFVFQPDHVTVTLSTAELRVPDLIATLSTLGPAKAVLMASPTSGAAPLTVRFSGQGSSLGHYRLRYGDGQELIGEVPGADALRVEHTYTQPGTYTVDLTVLGGGTDRSVATVTITVTGTQAKTGAIVGGIFTEVGGVKRPVAGGVVLLQDSATLRQIARATADATGTYRFTNIPFGTYDLVPVPSGGFIFHPERTTITLSTAELRAPDLVATLITASDDEAAYVSEDVPIQLAAGQTATAHITMRNTGGTTWQGNSQTFTKYQLSPATPAVFDAWGVKWVDVPNGRPIAPGQSFEFVFTIKAPSTPGTYPFQWQMAREVLGVSNRFGQPSDTVPIVVTSGSPGTKHAITGHVLLRMTTGDQNDTGLPGITVQLEATGTLDRVQTVAGSASQAGTYTFQNVGSGTYLVVPLSGGYTFTPSRQQVVVADHDVTVSPFIAVPRDDAAFVSQDVPAQLTPGQKAQARVTMRNTGQHAWEFIDGAFGGYFLQELAGDSAGWGIFGGIVNLPRQPVKPGEMADFVFTITAPTTPGTYPFQWRMARGNISGRVEFGQPTPQLTLTVSTSTNQKSGAIVGRIFTQVGGTKRPVAGGVVLLQDSATHREIARATADDTGTYRFANIAFGTYDLVPVPSGGFQFQPDHLTITLSMAELRVADLVAVLPPASDDDNAAFIDQDVPATLQPGQSVVVSVTMLNTGQTIWQSNSQTFTSYLLMSTERVDWGVGTSVTPPAVNLPQPSVAPRQTAEFRFTITAPRQPGQYLFQWRMIRQTLGVPKFFGEPTRLVQIAVADGSSPPVNGSGAISGLVLKRGGTAPDMPLPGATVELIEDTLAHDRLATVVTNDRGEYRFPNVAYRRYIITASLPGYRINPQEQVVLLASPEAKVAPFIATQADAAGAVLTTDVITGPPPLLVHFHGYDPKTAKRSSRLPFTFNTGVPGDPIGRGTDASVFEGLGIYQHPGRYTATLEVRDESGQKATASVIITVVSSPTGQYHIRGRVEWADTGEALEGAVVELSAPAAPVASQRQVMGAGQYNAYVFTDLPRGTYVVTATFPGTTMTPARQTVTITGTSPTEIELPPFKGRIAGPRVAAPTLNPPSGAKLTAPANVAVSTTTPDARIFCAIGNENLSETASALVTGSIQLLLPTWLRCRAYKTGFAPSEIVEAVYDVTGGDNAAFVSQDVPTKLGLGERRKVRVTMRNTGLTTWKPDANTYRAYHLAALPLHDRTWGVDMVGPDYPVLPRENADFLFTIIAPRKAGTYPFQWQMAQQSLASWSLFGQASQAVNIVVGSPATGGPPAQDPGPSDGAGSPAPTACMLSANPSTVPIGGNVTVKWDGCQALKLPTWITLAEPTSSSTGFVRYLRLTSVAPSGTITLSRLTRPGRFVARLFTMGWKLQAASDVITVGGSAPATSVGSVWESRR